MNILTVYMVMVATLSDAAANSATVLLSTETTIDGSIAVISAELATSTQTTTSFAETADCSSPADLPSCLSHEFGWIMDYQVLLEGPRIIQELEYKLHWMSITESKTPESLAVREQLKELARSIRPLIDELLSEIPEIDSLLSVTLRSQLPGNLVSRSEVMGSFILALTVAWTADSRVKPNEGDLISFRFSVASHIAALAFSHESMYSWISGYCDPDRTTHAVETSRFGSIDYAYNMEFYKLLDALKHVEPAIASTIDALIEFLRTHSHLIPQSLDMLDELGKLQQMTDDFVYFFDRWDRLVSSLSSSLDYLTKYEESIFML